MLNRVAAQEPKKRNPNWTVILYINHSEPWNISSKLGRPKQTLVSVSTLYSAARVSFFIILSELCSFALEFDKISLRRLSVSQLFLLIQFGSSSVWTIFCHCVIQGWILSFEALVRLFELMMIVLVMKSVGLSENGGAFAVEEDCEEEDQEVQEAPEWSKDLRQGILCFFVFSSCLCVYMVECAIRKMMICIVAPVLVVSNDAQWWLTVSDSCYS